jgi:hypothetical protein
MPGLLDTILRRTRDVPATPICPQHGVEMSLRGSMGRPARFEDQTQETYTAIYFCPVRGCGESKLTERQRSQIPVPGAPQPRPDYIRHRERP